MDARHACLLVLLGTAGYAEKLLPDVVQHVHLQANQTLDIALDLVVGPGEAPQLFLAHTVQDLQITLRWPGEEADAWRHGWVYWERAPLEKYRSAMRELTLRNVTCLLAYPRQNVTVHLIVVSDKPTDLEALYLRKGRASAGVERFLSGVEIPDHTMQAGDPVPLRLLLPPEQRSAAYIPIQITKLLPGARQPLVKQTAFQVQQLRLDADGSYRGQFTPPDAGGYFLDASFPRSGVHWTGSFIATSSIVKWGGVSFRADNCPAGRCLTAVAQLAETKPGDYFAEMTLQTDVGVKVVEGRWVTLRGGDNTIEFTFEAPRLWRAKAGGVLNVAQFRLMASSGTGVPPVRWMNLGNSPAYKLADWQPGKVWVERVAKAEPLVATDSNRFMAYSVQLEVTTPGGDCEWTAELVTPDGQPLDKTGGSAQLTPGKSTLPLRFLGYRIAQHAQNGAQRLTGIVLSCPGARLEDHDRIPTPPLTVAQFDPKEPNFAIRSSQSEFVIDAKRRVSRLDLRVEPLGGLPANARVTWDLGTAPFGLQVNSRLTTTMSEPNEVSVEVAGTVVPGRHPMEVTATIEGISRTLTFDWVIAAPVTRAASVQ